ncbi:MAG: hypothetical protein WCB70_02460 [Xanthobacteraceae bacterium]
MSKALLNTPSLTRYRADPCAFIEECLVSPYTREPYKLNDAERGFIKHAFTLDSDGRLLYPLMIFSAIKKSRKTEFAALIVIAMIVLLGGEYGEANIVANDQKQAVDRCFTACSRIIAASSMLCNEVKCTQDKITFLATGSTITALTNDAAGVAGGHPVISVFDELWTAPAGERGRRMFDALIPVPSRKISCRLVVSHAGIADESHLLYQLYQRGMQLPEIGANLHAGNGMLCFWSHSPLHPAWQTTKWLEEMRRELPPHQFMHMIENHFVPSQAAFITPAMWDAITQLPGPRASDPKLSIEIFVDAGWKHDDCVVVALTLTPDGNVEQVYHKIVTPGPNPVDFEDAIVNTILNLRQRFRVRRVVVDASQMAYVMQRLEKLKVPIEEQKQTAGNITQNLQTLYAHIRGGKLHVYPDQQMRDIATHVIFEETGTGLKLAKRQSVQKDYITALAMGCFMITQQQKKVVDLAHKYRAWDPNFRDEDLPPLPAAQAPKRVEEIAYSLGDWWQTRPQEPFHSEADENLKRMYRALAGPP